MPIQILELIQMPKFRGVIREKILLLFRTLLVIISDNRRKLILMQDILHNIWRMGNDHKENAIDGVGNRLKVALGSTLRRTFILVSSIT